MADDTLSAPPAALPARAESITWLPLAVAARRANVHPRTIRRQIDRGAILGRQEGRNWHVRAQDVDRLYGGEDAGPGPTASIISLDEWQRLNAQLVTYAERAGRADLLAEQLAELKIERDRLLADLAQARRRWWRKS
jgi:hypothetical protein